MLTMTFTPAVTVAFLALYLVSVNCTKESHRSSSTVRTSATDSSRGENLECKAEEEERVVMGYSDSWVVEVRGGMDEADRIADEHGFINLGQVHRFLFYPYSWFYKLIFCVGRKTGRSIPLCFSAC